MPIRTFLFITLSFFTGSCLFAQGHQVVSGKILNKEDGSALSYASIRLKNHPIGTISNEEGEFDFFIPSSKTKDTLSVSFIGFNTYEIALSSVEKNLLIELSPSVNVLDEVLLTEKGPLDYIRAALERMPENYPDQTYQSLAYYREKFIENGAVINKEEGVFKSLHPPVADSSEVRHQLLLYRPAEDPQQFQFMREWYESKQEKRRRKAIKKGEEIDEEEYDEEIDFDLGGPESVLDLDINKKKGNYLNPKHFNKYEYSFGEETTLNGERLVTVNFKARKKIDHMKDSGKILINTEDFAIVSIEQKGRFILPFMVKPILFVIGLKIESPTFSTVIQYQKFKDKWYPELFRWDAKVNLTKKHTFEANENSAINIGQVFSVNQLDAQTTEISDQKAFDPSEDMESQVFNDLNLKWEGLNFIKD